MLKWLANLASRTLTGRSQRLSAYEAIDRVQRCPQFGNSGPAGWGFDLVSFLSDNEAPHRDLLERFAAAHEGFSLTLPTADRNEDFVEGSLRWKSHEVLIYYETTLSHLSLWSAEREAVEELRALIAPLASAM